MNKGKTGFSEFYIKLKWSAQLVNKCRIVLDLQVQSFKDRSPVIVLQQLFFKTSAPEVSKVVEFKKKLNNLKVRQNQTTFLQTQ